MKQKFLQTTLMFGSILLLSLSGCATLEKNAVPLEPPAESTSEMTSQQDSAVSADTSTSEKQTATTSNNIKPVIVTELIVIGEVEPVTIVTAKTTFPARIDTGATTSSLDAFDIKRFERDGKAWVKFKIKDRRTGKTSELESKITRIAQIKRHGAAPQDRIVVKLKAKLGPKTLNTEFSLADRSSFEYPVLIGRNILDGNYIVDVSQKNSTSLMKEEK